MSDDEEEKPRGTFGESIENIYEENKNTINDSDVPDSSYANQQKPPQKLIYHHKKSKTNADFKTDALGKFFVEKQGQSSSKVKAKPSSRLNIF